MTLAVKYRPAQFSDICGQEIPVRIIQNSLKRDGAKIYLLSGTRGSGKTTLARLIGTSLDIESYDISEIDGASFNKVADVESIVIPFMSTYPKGDRKLLIIDECHMLSKSAWSALLKPLEDLASYMVVVFCTTDINKLMATILSRCVDIRLPNISVTAIADRLDYIAKQESIKAEDAALALIARLSEGSMREAISLLESCVLFSSDVITVNTVWSCINQIPDEKRAAFIKVLCDQDIIQMSKMLDSVSDILYFFEMLMSFLTSEIVLVAKNESTYFQASDLSYLQYLLKKMLNLQLRFAGSDISLSVMIRAFFVTVVKHEAPVNSKVDSAVLPIQRMLDTCGFVRVW